MREIKVQWAALSDDERARYEVLAGHVGTKMKAKRYKAQTFEDKEYA